MKNENQKQELPLTNAERYLALKAGLQSDFSNTYVARTTYDAVTKTWLPATQEQIAEAMAAAKKYAGKDGNFAVSEWDSSRFVGSRAASPSEVRRRIEGMRSRKGYAIFKELNDAMRLNKIKSFKDYIRIAVKARPISRGLIDNNVYVLNVNGDGEEKYSDIVEFIVAEGEIDGLDDEQVGRMLLADRV